MMVKKAIPVILLFLPAVVAARGGAAAPTLTPADNYVVHYIKDDPLFRLLPDPDDLGRLATGGSPNELRLFKQLYDSALQIFDIHGYNWLMSKVMNEEQSMRFSQAMAKIDSSQPHCDKGENPHTGPVEHQAEFPGGPSRSAFGFDLTQWMTNLLGRANSDAGSRVPGINTMSVMSMTMLKGLIQSVAAVVVDVVPPLIPPPVWILRPLPCLPMLTGANCLGSVLYPITMAEFTTADVSDSVMNGVIGSFPSKYQSKIGKTSEAQYRICASAYLGMYCASIFPICWMPLGLSAGMSMPVCFPQCLATLVACPGFWMQDIEGACSDVSVPPFCSFSVFINHRRIPPQYSTYEESHPYPEDCPKFDPLYDTPDTLFDVEKPLPSPIIEEAKKEAPHIPAYPSLGKTLKDYAHVQAPEHVEPLPCDCKGQHTLLERQCHLHAGTPVTVAATPTHARTHYQVPSAAPERCCRICRLFLKGPAETAPPSLTVREEYKPSIKVSVAEHTL
ncbi:hipothetical protein [Besnoitia besnoiti]|uniref:Hipothetical protein n=1 Tax=Besnoitia besnoiti TaxID=94643 RepID=A0A2A9MPE3_BESBE|nr:hipothetical protein [Besnoitia besnoiti]PFH38541.1 hipothetical protein [Besnoitia besnoiti]